MLLTFLGRDSGFGEKNNSAYYETDKKLILVDCGFTVFNILKSTFDFNKYDDIEIIVTHLHNDHAGSLSQLILYLWFIHHKKTTVISKCKHIKKYLEITGTPKAAYELKRSTNNIQFIKTNHVDNIGIKSLDAYGFILKSQDKNILYTGDTSTLHPFTKYFSKINELYVDISVYGGAHLKAEDIFSELKNLKDNNIYIYLMHMDDKEKIQKITNNEFYT